MPDTKPRLETALKIVQDYRASVCAYHAASPTPQLVPIIDVLRAIERLTSITITDVEAINEARCLGV